MPGDSSDIMTIEDVADFLRIPVSSVYKLAQSGKIPVTKIGRHWRFHRPTLVNFIAGQSISSILVDEKKNKPDKLDFS